MGKTIRDILSSLEENTEKTASADQEAVSEMEKLAAEMGLIDPTNNTSTPEEKQTKEASMSMFDLLNQMNPESADLLGDDQEKTAELEKNAALEEAMGEYAAEACAAVLDDHIEKIAAALVEAHGDAHDPHPQAVANNEDKSGKKIDTTPHIDLDAMKPGKPGEVGEQHVKAAALRKMALLSQLEE